MNGYSDDINHAFAFAAKYRAPYVPIDGEMTFLAHPANVAVILARHDADEVTIVAGILHHVLEVTPRQHHLDIRARIEDKFGVAVLALARAAFEPIDDERGDPLPWLHRKHVLLTDLMVMPPRAIDICCADEIHQCGTALAIVERLGAEYLQLHNLPSNAPELGCYDDILAVLDRRADWHTHGLRHELHSLKTRLEATLAAER
jgi:(p)ppGpp synthase/HD superfamily hydrolase